MITQLWFIIKFASDKISSKYGEKCVWQPSDSRHFCFSKKWKKRRVYRHKTILFENFKGCADRSRVGWSSWGLCTGVVDCQLLDEWVLTHWGQHWENHFKTSWHRVGRSPRACVRYSWDLRYVLCMKAKGSVLRLIYEKAVCAKGVTIADNRHFKAGLNDV